MLPCWPCLTQEAKDCWKFLFCWNVTGAPNLVVITTFGAEVTWPLTEPTTTFWVVVPGVVGVLVKVDVLLVLLGFCCSSRFCNTVIEPFNFTVKAKIQGNKRKAQDKVSHGWVFWLKLRLLYYENTPNQTKSEMIIKSQKKSKKYNQKAHWEEHPFLSILCPWLIKRGAPGGHMSTFPPAGLPISAALAELPIGPWPPLLSSAH